MFDNLHRWGLSLLATVGLVLLLWYSSSWMQAGLIGYVVMVNFAVMGWAWFIFDIHKPPLTSRWFKSVSLERNGQLYRDAGLLWFRKMLQFVGWNKLLGVPNLRKDFESLKQMEWGTRFGEATHWICLATLLPIAGWSVVSLKGTGFIYWLISAIVFHAYPIMLQRYHRPRFRRLLMKMSDRGPHPDRAG